MHYICRCICVLVLFISVPIVFVCICLSFIHLCFVYRMRGGVGMVHWVGKESKRGSVLVGFGVWNLTVLFSTRTTRSRLFVSPPPPPALPTSAYPLSWLLCLTVPATLTHTHIQPTYTCPSPPPLCCTLGETLLILHCVSPMESAPIFCVLCYPRRLSLHTGVLICTCTPPVPDGVKPGL